MRPRTPRSVAARYGLRLAMSMLALVLALAMTNRSAEAQDYYAGKTIRVIVPQPAGGTFDTLARLVTQHMPRLIPGQPTMIVENLTGGGGIVGTRAAAMAKPDGLTLLHTPSMAAIQEALGQYGEIKFSEFDWLGSVAGAAYAVLLKSEFADQPIETLRTSQVPIKLGINGPGGLIHETTKLVKAVSGLNIQLISGYQGAAPIILALKQGEIDGFVGGVEVLLAHPLANEMYRDGSVKPMLLVGGSTPPKEMADVLSKLPDLRDSITDPTDLAALESIVGVVAITRVFGAPPGTPPEQLAILKSAFDALMKDEAFVADITKAGFFPSPTGAEQTTETLKALSGRGPEVIERIRKILE